MEINNEEFNHILSSLENIKNKLIEANTLSGAFARFEEMKNEIKIYGWDYIVNKYHPDINIEDSAAHELFEFYKLAYDSLDRC